MNRRSASLPKSPLNTRAFLRRALTRGPAALALPLLAFSQSAQAANTEYDVINGKTDLTAPATYTTGGTAGTGAGGTVSATGPTVTSDVTFDSGTTYSPTAFTLNSSQTFGSLNDLSATALTIANTSATGTGDTLTLGGSGDPGSSVPGSAVAGGDLLFVATGGTLTINSGAAGAATALGLVLGQSGNFDVAGTATIGSAISGAFNFTKTGAGLLTLSGAVGNGGTITNAGTGTTGNLVSTSTATPAASLYISGAISNSVTGIVQNSATSDLLLGASNTTYTNGITVQSGTLLVDSKANALGASTNVVTLGNSSANATLQFGGRLGNVTGANENFANPINVNGTGTNVLSATDYGVTYSGPITLGGGGTNLTLATLNASGSSITISGGVTGAGNIIVSDDFANVNGVVNFTTAQVNNTGTITFNNAVVNGGTLGTAAGTNTITGGVGSNVTAITTSSAINPLTISTNALNVNSGGTTLTNANTTAGVFTVSGGVTGTGNLTLDNNSAIANGITISTNGVNNVGAIFNAGTGTGNVLISANIGANVTGGITQNSATSVLTLSGTNIYSGATTINAGTIDFANVNAMPAASAVTVNSGGTIAIGVGAAAPLFTNGTSGNGTIGGIFSGLGGQSGSIVTLNPGSAVGIDTTSASTTYAGNITNAGIGLAKLGANTFTLTGANTYTGATTVSAGTLQIGGAGTLGSGGVYAAPIATATGGTLEFSSTAAQTFSGVISGTGALTKDTGTGALTLSNANTLSGATTVSAGTIVLTNPLALQNSVATNSVANGFVFDSSVTGNAFTFGALGGSSNLALVNNAATPGTHCAHPECRHRNHSYLQWRSERHWCDPHEDRCR